MKLLVGVGMLMLSTLSDAYHAGTPTGIVQSRLPLASRRSALLLSDTPPPAGDEAGTTEQDVQAPPPPSAPQQAQERSEPSFSVKDVLTALPYALGLCAITTLLMSQAGLFDNFDLNLPGIEIPAEWLEES